MAFTIPNCLTLFRIVAIPVIVGVYLSEPRYSNWICTILFILAGISDALDGHLARKWNQTSKMGAFLDPVADKLLVSVLLILIATNMRLLHATHLPVLFIITVIIIVGREITISALREWMAEVGKRSNVAVSWIGKYKTGIQMTAIGFLLFKNALFGLPVLLIGEILLYIAGILTVWSMCSYLFFAYKAVQNEDFETESQ